MTDSDEDSKRKADLKTESGSDPNSGADLTEKTNRYRRLLSRALDSVEVVEESDEADEFLEMAESYYDDGEHFLENDDEVNALAAFSYGHAWLDAGMRSGIFDADDNREIFTV